MSLLNGQGVQPGSITPPELARCWKKLFSFEERQCETNQSLVLFSIQGDLASV